MAKLQIALPPIEWSFDVPGYYGEPQEPDAYWEALEVEIEESRLASISGCDSHVGYMLTHYNHNAHVLALPADHEYNDIPF